MSASATAPVAEIRLCRREMLRRDEVRTTRDSVSRAFGRKEQSSRRKETRPGSGAVTRQAVIYSTAFLSRFVCDKSRNCRLFALEAYAPMTLNAGVFNPRLDATDK